MVAEGGATTCNSTFAANNKGWCCCLWLAAMVLAACLKWPVMKTGFDWTCCFPVVISFTSIVYEHGAYEVAGYEVVSGYGAVSLFSWHQSSIIYSGTNL